MVTRAMSAEIAQAIRDSYDRVAEEYARRIYAELQSKPLDRAEPDFFSTVYNPESVSRANRTSSASTFSTWNARYGSRIRSTKSSQLTTLISASSWATAVNE